MYQTCLMLFTLPAARNNRTETTAYPKAAQKIYPDDTAFRTRGTLSFHRALLRSCPTLLRVIPQHPHIKAPYNLHQYRFSGRLIIHIPFRNLNMPISVTRS